MTQQAAPPLKRTSTSERRSSSTARMMVKRSVSRSGSTTCVSGSPKRQLYSMTLGPSLVSMRPEVEAALEGAPLGVHRLHRRQEDFPHAALGYVRRVEGVGGDGAHAAGVEAGVAVVGALVVHGRNHGNHGLAVGEGEHGYFRAFQKLLDDHAVAALAKGMVAHGVPDRFLGLPRAFADQHALAQRQTVGLDHQRRGRAAHVGKRRFGIVKHLALGRGMPYFCIRRLEKTLLASISAARASGPKQGTPSACRRSTQPMASGSSGATTAKSMRFSAAKRATPSMSVALISTHSASCAMPPLPGRA